MERLGIILTVTGILALVHYRLRTSGGHLPPKAQLIVGIVLVALGVPLYIVAVALPK